MHLVLLKINRVKDEFMYLIKQLKKTLSNVYDNTKKDEN